MYVIRFATWPVVSIFLWNAHTNSVMMQLFVIWLHFVYRWQLSHSLCCLLVAFLVKGNLCSTVEEDTVSLADFRLSSLSWWEKGWEVQVSRVMVRCYLLQKIYKYPRTKNAFICSQYTFQHHHLGTGRLELLTTSFRQLFLLGDNNSITMYFNLWNFTDIIHLQTAI